MRTRAAVLRSHPGKWEIVELDLDDPKDDEVLVKVDASGVGLR